MKTPKKLTLLLLWFLFLVSCEQEPKFIKLTGPVFGTAYNIQYFSDDHKNYQKQFDSLFAVINESMSTYIPDSKISRINRGDTMVVDEHFKSVFRGAKQIYRKNEGAFDPTIGAVVNAWDFGPEGKITNVDSTAIDSLMKTVGFNRVGMVDGQIIKRNTSYLDFNAIAKGYGVDVIGKFLSHHRVENYLVEIGGEIRVKGVNLEKQSGWKVGIDDPNFDGTQSYSKVITLKDESMATSGTYRKFKLDENGNRYTHIINTKTGYPSKTNVLSVSVIARNCMTADGYATAFQAMGIEKSKQLLDQNPEMKAYFIYEGDNGELKTLGLNNFPE